MISVLSHRQAIDFPVPATHFTFFARRRRALPLLLHWPHSSHSFSTRARAPAFSRTGSETSEFDALHKPWTHNAHTDVRCRPKLIYNSFNVLVNQFVEFSGIDRTPAIDHAAYLCGLLPDYSPIYFRPPSAQSIFVPPPIAMFMCVSFRGRILRWAVPVGTHTHTHTCLALCHETTPESHLHWYCSRMRQRNIIVIRTPYTCTLRKCRNTPVGVT